MLAEFWRSLLKSITMHVFHHCLSLWNENNDHLIWISHSIDGLIFFTVLARHTCPHPWQVDSIKEKEHQRDWGFLCLVDIATCWRWTVIAGLQQQLLDLIHTVFKYFMLWVLNCTMQWMMPIKGTNVNS